MPSLGNKMAGASLLSPAAVRRAIKALVNATMHAKAHLFRPAGRDFCG
jgi:hypothetical protein